jgi:N-acetylglucosamine malate deacetylase 1
VELDFLAFAAHPDDAELSMGGTIAKMIKKNKTFGIIDLTEGELGTRGNRDTRAEEAELASKILDLTLRENIGLPDGNIFVTEENTLKIISVIRKYKPKILFAPYFNDRHPDHIEASKLVKRAMFFSGLPRIETESDGEKQNAFRPKKLFYFIQTYEFEPTFIVDVSETFDIKMKSVRAYKTQFHVEGNKNSGPSTFISNPEFVKYLEARSKSFGFKIGKEYGEPFFSEESVELDLDNYLENIL